MQIYEFTEFLKDPLCQTDINYELFINGFKKTAQQNFASLDYNSQTLKPQLLIFSTNNDFALQSPLHISIKGSLVNYDNSTLADYLYIELTLLQENSNPNPPDFKEAPPKEFVFNTLTSQVLKFPDLEDADGDKIGTVKVNFGILKQFITGEFPTFRINPGFNIMGEYPISITVQDDNNNPITRVFNFILKIQKQVDQIPNKQNTTQNNETDGKNQNNLMITNNPDQISQNLNVRIKSVSNQGVARIFQMHLLRKEVKFLQVQMDLLMELQL
eukprot:403356872